MILGAFRGWALAPLLFLVLSTKGQVVQQVEYYFDHDPGYGNATELLIESPSSNVSISELISTENLNQGFHVMYLRCRAVGVVSNSFTIESTITNDTLAAWGISEQILVYVSPSDLELGLVATLEYFFDDDPGYGLGISIDPFAAQQNPIIHQLISTSALAAGFHTLFLRPQLEGGLWGIPEQRLVFVDQSGTSAAVDNMEYFFDDDPGYGLGTPLDPFESQQNPVLNQLISTSGLTAGFHTLFLRPQLEGGVWGIPEQRLFFVDQSGISSAVDNLEYFFDDDPGYGLGIPMNPITPQQNVQLEQLVSTTELSVGFHTLFVRPRLTGGKWGIPEGRLVFVDQSGTMGQVEEIEYFFDEDPGYGQGTKVDPFSIQASVQVAQLVSGESLSTGFHTLFVRAKLVGGAWGIPEQRPIYVDAAGSVLPNLVELEYFFDEDPGYGQGIAVPINPAEPNPVKKLFLDAATLPGGEHVVGIRAKSESNVWSIVETMQFVSFPPSRELDSVSLLVFYNQTEGIDWTNNTGWVSSKMEGWYGITIKGNRVDSIKLDDNFLIGKLPRQLAYVDEASYISLSGNLLRDTVPETFTDFKQLKTLLLSNNGFNEIPEISTISGIDRVALDSNYFDFGDLEPLISIPNLTYSNQRILKEFPVDSTVSIGQSITFNKFIEGASNTYQWFQNENPIDFADLQDYQIQSFNSGDTGTYLLRVNNSIITDLQLETAPYHLRISDFEEDSLALVSLYNALGGPNWSGSAGWLTGTLNTWEGVTIQNDRVTGLNLSSKNLNGKLPADFWYADAIQTLDISSNTVRDTIPDTYTRMRLLQNANVSQNRLTSIPAFNSVTSLTNLDVSQNQLQFGDLEKNLGVTGFAYANQDSVGMAADTVVDIGSNLALQRLVSGANNDYQWLQNGTEVSGTSAKTNTIQVSNIQFVNEGKYILRVTNSLVPGLTLYSKAFGLGVSSLRRDSLALLTLYNKTKGDNWATAVNWKTAKISDNVWTGVTLGSNRVTALNLSGFNLQDTIPVKLRDITSLVSANFSNNNLTSLPNLSVMPQLTTLNISGNRIGFSEVEINRNIGNFTYSPMKNFSTDVQVKLPVGSSHTMEVKVSGKNNVYQWYLNDALIAGATKPTHRIGSIEYDSMGFYQVAVGSTVINDLTIESGVNEVLATADLAGRVLRNNSPYANGFTTLYRVVSGPYDSVAFSTMNQSGEFVFRDQVLGDYVIKTFPTEKLFATYYRSTINWKEAETIPLREQTADQFDIVLAGTITPPGLVERVTGLLELEVPDGNRVTSRRKVKKAACSMRRFKIKGRDLQEEFDRELYVETDDEGVFKFYDLEAGRWRLDIDFPGVPIDETSFVIFEVKEGQNLELLAVITDSGIVVEQTNALYFHVPYLKDIVVYPNPSSEFAHLKYNVNREIEGMNLEVLTLDGRLVKTEKMPHARGVQNAAIDVGELEPGVYFLLLRSSNDEVIVQRKLIVD